MKSQKLPYKRKVLLFYITGVLAIVIIGIGILNKVIQNKVREKLEQLSPFAKISYSSINANLLTSSISFDDLAMIITPDTSDLKYQQRLNFRSAELKGISFLKMVFQKRLSVNRLSLTQGEIILRKVSEENIRRNQDSLQLNDISINHIDISETNVLLHLDQESNFKIEQFEIIDLNKPENGNIGFADLECRLSKFNSVSTDNRRLQIATIQLDSKKELLRIDSLKITTQYSKLEFGKKLGHQADYIEAASSQIKLLSFNVQELLNKKLVADNAVINDSKVYVFRDRRLPRELKEQPMPNGYLKEIPLEVRIHTLRIKNATIVSEEFPKEGTQTGSLKIVGINLSMTPVINHPNKTDPSYSNTILEGSIMGAGTIRATIRAPLRENIYIINGAIKNLDLPKLNPSSENLGKFHVESGTLDNLDFQFTATEQKATGKIVGEYHNLVIQRLKVKDGVKQIAKVPTFFLKNFIIPKDKDKSLDVAKRTGKIDYKRDPTRIVSFYFLKALLDGIRSSFDLGFLLPQ